MVESSGVSQNFDNGIHSLITFFDKVLFYMEQSFASIFLAVQPSGSGVTSCNPPVVVEPSGVSRNFGYGIHNVTMFSCLIHFISECIVLLSSGTAVGKWYHLV